MRLLLNLRKGTSTFYFESPLKMKGELKLNSAQIKWEIYNVGLNEKVAIDTTEHSIPYGYYTFDDLKDYFESINVTISLEKSGHCTITPPSGNTLKLQNIAPLLGFNKDKELSSKELSPYIVNVHGGLDFITIFCNRINLYKNQENGKRSEKLCKILVPSGSLWGVTSFHSFENAIIPMEKSEISNITFDLEDTSYITDKNSYTVFLDCELN